MPTAIALVVVLIGACSTLPLMSDDEHKANVCIKAHMTAKRLPDGRVVCVK